MEAICRRVTGDIYVILMIYLGVSAVYTILFFHYLHDKPILSVENEIDEFVKNLNTTLNRQRFGNLTDFERVEYLENIFERRIDWGLQRQLTWGVILLTFLTIFVMLLFEIREIVFDLRAEALAEREPERGEIKRKRVYVCILFLASILILVFAMSSTFMLLYWYDEVKLFEERLLLHPTSPFESTVNFIKNLFVPLAVIAIFILIVICFRRARQRGSRGNLNLDLFLD